MNRIMKVLLTLILCFTMVFCVVSLAEGTVSTQMVMRVSRLTQKAVVNMGEDLSLELSVAGVTPASYQWYYEGVPVTGANQSVFYINNAQVEQSGIYRVDAFDEAGNMIVTMDVSTRIVDPTVPKSGDDSMPIGIAAAVFAVAAAVLGCSFRKKVKA